MPKSNIENQTTKTSSHWVKQAYYYLVIGVGVLFLSIGIFSIVRASLVRFVFTSVDDFSYGINQCEFQYTDKGQSTLSESEKATCQRQADENKTKQAKINFERDTLNGTLTMIIALTVLALHKKFVKIQD
jgi:hypothetical protein